MALACVLGVFGVVALLLAATRALAGRKLAATGYVVQGTILLGLAVLLWSVGSDLASYEPQQAERPMADVYFEQIAEQRFRATLTRLPGGRMQVFELTGDAWRLDVRTLEFRGWARAIGLAPVYRLDRLVAVVRGTGASDGAVSGFALAEHRGFDLWTLTRRNAQLARIVGAAYTEGRVTPMTGDARYELRLANGRIETQAANEAAAVPPGE
jgi:hypothetical protein